MSVLAFARIYYREARETAVRAFTGVATIFVALLVLSLATAVVMFPMLLSNYVEFGGLNPPAPLPPFWVTFQVGWTLFILFLVATVPDAYREYRECDQSD